jgi:hypothetical protein
VGRAKDAVKSQASSEKNARKKATTKRLVGGIRGWLGGSRLSWTGQGFGPATL